MRSTSSSDGGLVPVGPDTATRWAREAMSGYLAAAAVGGLLLFVMEAGDRLVTLRESFLSWSEPVFFAAYLAPAALLGFAGGCLIAVALLAVGLAHRATARALGRFTAHRGAMWIAAVVVSIAIAGALVAASSVAPELVEKPLLGVARKVDAKVLSIKPVIASFTAFLSAGFVAAALTLVGAAAALASRPARRGRAIAGAGSALALAGLVGAYVLDSRFSYGRYELTIHLPALAAEIALAFAAAGLAFAAFGGRPPRRLTTVVAGLAGVAVAASAFGFAHLGASENLKALLWRRSVVARRAFQAIALAADRDGDGFTSILAGGDPDDRNASAHPLATEVPGNGLDDNGIGGDAIGGVPPAASPAAAGTPRASNFLFIAVDTLRASRMSLYGYHRPTTPRIAEHAMRAVVFERGFSPASNTGLAFAAIQRSTLRGAIFDKERPTLFATLAAAGYRTAQINARRDDVWLETRRWRRYRKVLLDGVTTIDHTGGDALWDADRVTDRAIEYLASLPADSRHATWLHYLDPHEPRRKMAPFDFGDGDSNEYDSEVAFADREIGRLLDALSATGALENTIVVLVADHGEAFGEHGMHLHGNRPHDDQVWVPLVVWAPGVEGRRVATPATLLDVAPTVLGALGLPGLADAEGVDLLAGDPGDRPIFHETPMNLVEPAFHAFAVTQGGWRLIWDVRGNTVELYDLTADPRELRNLADVEPERREAMRRTLGRWLDETKPVQIFREGAGEGE